ncbi:MAG: hypothetical protein DRQ78_03290 [Epsilonproteobacteria bacterium]|nr:MAG: hypothetical protein DRQ78_03290 [Campylobacterota bacterium]
MKTLSAFLLIFMLALSGCGSSGDNVNNSSVSSTDPEASKFLKVFISEDKTDNTVIDINQYVVVTFSSNINAATVEASSMYIRDESGHYLEAKLTTDNNRVSILPNAYFLPSKQYTIVVTTAVEDMNGKRLENIFTFPFMTSSAPDTSAPSLLSLSPVDGTTVEKSASISMEFDETIADNGVSLQVTDTGRSVIINGTSTVNGNVLRFVPGSDLTQGANYTVALQGTVEDEAGNAYSGTSSWSFSVETEVDVTAPSLLSLTPDDGASADKSTYISMEFDEIIDDNGVLLQVIDAGTLATINGTSTVAGNILRFVPDNDLTPGANYTVTLQGSVEDEAGNAYSGTSSWGFSIDVVVDVTAPSLISLTPADGASADKTTEILMTFDEAISNTGALLKLKNNDTNANVKGTEILNNNVIRFVPASDLIPGNNYTVTVLGPIEDMAGNSYTGITSWSFSVIDEMSVLLVECDIDSKITVRFSDDLNLASVSPSDFSIIPKVGVPLTFQNYDERDDTVTFESDLSLDGDEDISISGTIMDINTNKHNGGVARMYALSGDCL